jgi:hypothetical protein
MELISENLTNNLNNRYFEYILGMNNGCEHYYNNVYLDFKFKRELTEIEYKKFLKSKINFDIFIPKDILLECDTSVNQNIFSCNFFHNKKLDMYQIPLFVCEELKNVKYCFGYLSAVTCQEICVLCENVSINYYINDELEEEYKNILFGVSYYNYYKLRLPISFILLEVESDDINKIYVNSGDRKIRVPKENIFIFNDIILIVLNKESICESELKNIKYIDGGNIISKQDKWIYLIPSIDKLITVHDDNNKEIKVNECTLYYKIKIES